MLAIGAADKFYDKIRSLKFAVLPSVEKREAWLTFSQSQMVENSLLNAYYIRMVLFMP